MPKKVANKMKRIWLYILLLPMVVLASCTHKAEVPDKSALYRHYEARQELKVAELAGFKLNDTVRVDVVMLQAETEKAWQRLVEEMAIDDTVGYTSWIGNIDEPAIRATWDGTPVMPVIASLDKRVVGFYRLDNEEQYDALLDYQLEKMKCENEKIK